MSRTLVVAITVAALAVPSPAAAPSYADIAALTLAAPVIVRADVAKTERIAAADAPGLAPGRARLLVRAKVAAALVAPAAVPPEVEYLWDAPLDARGKPPQLKGVPVLLFLRGDAARPGQYQLIAANAQLDGSGGAEATARAVLAEARRGDVPMVTGVDNAFRVAGSVAGEAESQFHLTTADGKPVSLVLLTRPGQPQRLSVALGDVIDDAAPPVRRDTLLWYRLACFLPRTLPAAATAGVEPGDAAAVAADYAAALALLGPCA